MFLRLGFKYHSAYGFLLRLYSSMILFNRLSASFFLIVLISDLLKILVSNIVMPSSVFSK